MSGGHVDLTSTESISSTGTAITWDAEVEDDNNYWDSGDPTKLVAPANDWYLTTFGILWATDTTQVRSMYMLQNGSTNYPVSSSFPQFATGTAHPNRQGSGMCLYLSASDYLEIWGKRANGATDVNISDGHASMVRLLNSGGAHVSRSTNQSIGSGSDTALSFTTTVRDDTSYFSVGSPTRLTAPTTGWYVITASIAWEAFGQNRRKTKLRKNGSTVYYCQSYEFGGGEVSRAGGSMTLYLTAGDYIEVLVWQDSGSNHNVTAASFSMVRISEQHGAHVHTTSNKSIANNSVTAVSFDAAVQDDNSFWSGGSPTKLTVPTGQDGWYVMSQANQWQSNTGNSRTTEFRVNGSTIYRGHTSRVTSAIDHHTGSSFATYLAAGDYVEVIAFQAFGSAQNITASDFAIARIGNITDPSVGGANKIRMVV